MGAFKFLIDPKNANDFYEKILSSDFDEQFFVPHFVTRETHQMFRRFEFNEFSEAREAAIFEFESQEIIGPVSRRMGVAIGFERNN